MDQSFDATSLTLDQAADLVAIRARMGGGHEKVAVSPLNAALIGGGLGLGTGALATMLSKRKKKRWARNMILGTLLGAGVGGAGGYAANTLGSAIGQTPESNDLARLRELMGDQAPSGREFQMGPITGAILGDGEFDPSKIADPAARAEAIEIYGRLQSQGNVNLDEAKLPTSTTGDTVANAVSNLPRVAEYGALGYGAGRGVTALRDLAHNHRAVTSQEIKDYTLANKADAQARLGGTKPTRKMVKQIGESVPTTTSTRGPARTVTVRGRSIPIWPGAKTTTHTFTRGSGSTVGLTPHQTNQLSQGARATRTPRKGGRKGGYLGAGLGVLYALATGGGAKKPEKWSPTLKATP